MTKKKIIKKINLDEIASADGFPILVAKLTGPECYSLYSNEDRSVNRVYESKTGKVINEYSPRRNLDSARKFHHPSEFMPQNMTFAQVRWYNGKGNRIKRR